MASTFDHGPGESLPEVVPFRSLPPMRYQHLYVGFVFVSVMDVLLTWTILSDGGSEVNPVAAMIIDAWQMPGALLFKFSLMMFVIIACEVTGRHRDRLGRRLAMAAVVISSVPVVYSIGLLTYHHVVAPVMTVAQ